MKKFSILTLLVVLMLSLTMVFTACSSSSDDPPPPPGGGEAFSFEGPWDDIIKPYGNNPPTITGNEIAVTASSSTGFFINFEDIGYTYNSEDILIFTYEVVEITTPSAVITLKNPKAWGSDMASNSAWGVGKGREYVLGDETKSNYSGADYLVEGTYDTATKIGTFEVLARLLTGATAVGFQHNYWAEFSSVKVGETSEYKIKILKIENGVDDSELPPPPAEGEGYDDTTGMTSGIQVQGNATLDPTTGEIKLGKGLVEDSSLIIISAPGATSTSTITIKYICKVEEPAAKLTLKDGSWSKDPIVGNGTDGCNWYPELTPDVPSTLTVKGNWITDPTSIWYQCNDYQNENAAFYLKIISVTVE